MCVCMCAYMYLHICLHVYTNSYKREPKDIHQTSKNGNSAEWHEKRWDGWKNYLLFCIVMLLLDFLSENEFIYYVHIKIILNIKSYLRSYHYGWWHLKHLCTLYIKHLTHHIKIYWKFVRLPPQAMLE